jgi:hypothetical protein
MNHRIATPKALRPSRRWASIPLALAIGLALAAAAYSQPSARCTFCGKNLIKNPGAEAGLGLTQPGAFGSVPGWTVTAGQFGAAAYTGFGIGWFNTTSKGPKGKGKNYFFGGTTPAATTVHASIGTQAIKLPGAAAGHQATLSGWLGNYTSNTTQVRAEFTNASGKLLSAIRIGPDPTIGGADMAFRTRHGKVPAGAVGVTIVITFTDHANYNLAGADNLSLLLS